MLWLGFVVVFRRPLESGIVSLEEELFTEEELSVEEVELSVVEDSCTIGAVQVFFAPFLKTKPPFLYRPSGIVQSPGWSSSDR